MTTELLELEAVGRDFDVSPPWLERAIERRARQLLRAVDSVSFAIAAGETFALVGESGCGKSTVARLIAGLYRPSRGRLLYAGEDLAAPAVRERARAKMQMIFQDPYASLNPRWTVARIIAEPMRAQGMARDEAQARVSTLLTQVGLAPGDAARYPHEFSGGQRQRISIARALSSNPELLICDEPTSALDVSVQAQILNLMRELQAQHRLAYLFISHNLAVVAHVADRVGVMYLGRLVEVAPVRVLFTAPRHPYTRMLLDAVPDLTMSGKPRTPVAGEVPNPLAPPAGCGFHPRCPLASERCRGEVPELRGVEGGGFAACHAVGGR